ncbi:sensor histidine kinase [Amphibacillus indicireducens]|uniref:histidine kinase n=1 Tax=Amphibacillus indicireducens TaxID=1076330 RepID=A0ABP7W3A7_9BACI
MSRIKQFYLQLKLRNKVLIISLISGLFPLLLLGIFGYNQIYQLLYEREQKVLEETMNQTILRLDNKINAYNNGLNYILLDHNLNTELSNIFTSNYQMYLFFRDTLNPLFYNSLALNRDLSGITLYTDIEINSHGNFLRPLSDIEHYDWFEKILQTTQPIHYVSENASAMNFAVELFTGVKDTRTIINLSVHYQALFDSLNKLFDDHYGIFVFDSNGKLLFDFQKNTETNESYLQPNEVLSTIQSEQFENNFVYKQGHIPSADWTTVLLRPVDSIYHSIKNITIIFFVVTLISVVLLFSLVYLFSRVIVRPLENLALNMQAINFENFTVTVKTNSDDEISTLISIFRTMVQRIEQLINEVYLSKIEKQEYALKALQAQINPHFFYNALSLINSKAILADQEEISLMTQYLSTFYRTTLNKGQDFITIDEEVQNVVSYLKIQHMMHDQSFDYYLNIDEAILNYQMPNLTLQPIVENSILHGLDHIENERRGLILIEGRIENDQIIFMISDNGQGMSREQLEIILTTETNGYGIRNVHNRIQLIYGNNHGLKYDSQLNQGTLAIVTLPLTNKY